MSRVSLRAVVIKRSVARETQALVAELSADDEVRREAAIARLAVIGTRAVDRVIAALTAQTTTRGMVAALRTLESIGDIRALAPASTLVESGDPDVGAAAVAVLRAFLHDSKTGTSVLDRLVATSLDLRRPDAVRLAALDAIAEMGSRVVIPVWERLRDDPSLAVQQRAAKATGGVEPLDELRAAAQGVLPDDPAALRALVEKTGASAPLATLHRLVEICGAHEHAERIADARAAWLSVRGTIHLALADRDSRVALYDLRDTIAEATAPLPASFVAALRAIGDGASLEALATAYTRAVAAGLGEWAEALQSAFRAVAEREQIGPRHAVSRRIQAKWPAAAEALIEKRAGRRKK